jgi:septal ring-binding cell division protein DamX
VERCAVREWVQQREVAHTHTHTLWCVPLHNNNSRTARPSTVRGPKICMPMRAVHVSMSASRPAVCRMTPSEAAKTGTAHPTKRVAAPAQPPVPGAPPGMGGG